MFKTNILSTDGQPFILLSLLLSSCASIMNSPIQCISIATDKNVKAISINKAVFIDSPEPNTTHVYYVARNRQPLTIQLQTDSSIRIFTLRPKNSAAYWLNIIENYGIGMLVDKNNPKRYAYRMHNYLSIKDSTIKNNRFGPITKGTINLLLSTTFATAFDVNTTNGRYNSGGVLGFEASLDYFYAINHYISTGVGAASNGFYMDYFGADKQQSSVQFISIRNNHVLGSFDVGYGLNLSKFNWAKYYFDSTKANESVKSTGFGLSFSAQYKFSNQFRLGILYQPNILNTSFTPSFNYQHYISFNLIWKLPIKKGK